MLHIKDIEAFARINEALARDSDAPREDAAADNQHPPAHPALLLAMVATGRLKPEETDGDAQGESTAEPRRDGPATLADMMARMWAPRGR